MNRENVGLWTQAAKESYREKYGTENYISGDARPYHPAARVRIRNKRCVQEKDYERYTNYATGEIGSRWKDENGREWETVSFASRENQLVITRMLAPEGDTLNVEIAMDSILEMPVEQEALADYDIPKAPETVESAQAGQEIWLCQCGKYGSFPIGGKNGGRLCEFHQGGWATAVRIFTDGEVRLKERRKDIVASEKFSKEKESRTVRDAKYPVLCIEKAGRIVLAAGIDRKTDGLKNERAVEEILLLGMKEDIRRKTEAYLADGIFDYEKALKNHCKTHKPAFKRVSLELCGTEEEQADRCLSNEALMEKQRRSGKMNKAYVERLFSQGRFALLCSSGYQAPRLGGMWTGCFMPLFHGGFISNANLNLQMSSAAIGNMPEAMEGYIHFLLRQLPDWERNAECIYGMKHAIKAPVHTSGEGNGLIYHSLPGYPHAYCNGNTDWMILPVFEYYECFGNRKIPVGEEVDPKRLRDVCEYSDRDVERILSEGFDLLKDILAPLMRGLMSFWCQYVDERFYMDEKGTLHMDDGTVLSDCEGDGRQPCYLLTPGYSPENAPGGEGYNDVQALAANTAMDIAAMKNSFVMAERIARDTDGLAWDSRWEILEKRIPPYLYAGDGALKEWALDFLPENDDHRHVSHGYAAWPAHEFRRSRKLCDGIKTAVDNRTRFNRGDDAMAHGHLHKAMIAARLNDVKGFEQELETLTLGEYQYTSLMTAHDKGRKSAYCTDLAISYPGLLLEALVYSNEKELEFLPALPGGWTKGKLKGAMARCQAEIVSLSWNCRQALQNKCEMESGEADEPVIRAEILPGRSGAVEISAGISWKSCMINGKMASVIGENEMRRFVRCHMEAGKKAVIEFYV